MATPLMQSFEQQYSQITSEIVSSTGKISNLTGIEKQEAIKHVEKLMEETMELLEQMDIEIHEMPVKDRDRFVTRVKSYRAELSKLEKDLRRARIAFSDDVHLREELMGSDNSHQTEDQRARLLDSTERLERSSHRLDVGYKTCLETEQMGAQMLEDLHSQRATLQHARDRLRGTNEAIGKSSRVLSGMIRRAIQNRVILIVLVLVILLVIGIGIFLAVRRS